MVGKSHSQECKSIAQVCYGRVIILRAKFEVLGGRNGICLGRTTYTLSGGQGIGPSTHEKCGDEDPLWSCTRRGDATIHPREQAGLFWTPCDRVQGEVM